MASLNKVQLIGNLGQEPETRYTQDGSAITNISIATTDKYKDKKTGEPKEVTEWHRIVFFGKLAEIAGEYLKKGRSVYVEGKLRTRKWTDKDNIERYTTEIVADSMQMLGGAKRDDDHIGNDSDNETPAQKAQKIKHKPQASNSVPVNDDGIDDADIPDNQFSDQD